MITGKEVSRAGFEGPAKRPDEDRYGFTLIAAGLAQSICALDENISTVIGIEGRWGAGKTTLLNFLSEQLRVRVPSSTQIIPFTPWLNSPDESPVTALLLTIAARLNKLDTSVGAHVGKISPLAENILVYAQQTSRRFAPLTRFAGKFVPGGEFVADVMDTLSDTDLSWRGKTASELRIDIENKITELGVSFIVVIDDLDRLEPAQAVEILRMVRSVADFSRFRYVMCYDRDVLAHAVESSLGVQNGALYLQKIVPLSFCLPRPEGFDLRREFREGALALWKEVNEGEPEKELLQTLAGYTMIYGEALSTPREVNQALNGVRFRYSGLRDYIFFPDLCLIQLLVTVNPALATWVEHYLTEWSIVENRDGDVSDEDQVALAENLRQALRHFGSIQARHIYELHDWLPGIEGFDDKTLRLFSSEARSNSERANAQRRLGSPVYWRFYFSFSAPQNVMSDADIKDLLTLAASNYTALERRLLNSITANGVSSRTWFEHILTRLTPVMTKSAGSHAQKNLLQFLFRCSDSIIPFYRERDLFFRPEELGLYTLASQLITQLKKRQPALAMSYISRLFRDARAFAWATCYLSVISRQGDGDPVTREELSHLCLMMKIRLEDDDVRHAQAQISHLSGFLNAWRDVIGLEEMRAWVREAILDDRAFLQMLLNLRTAVSSSNLGTYLRLNMEALQNVFGITGVEKRLDHIKNVGEDTLQKMVAEVENAMKLNNE